MMKHQHLFINIFKIISDVYIFIFSEMTSAMKNHLILALLVLLTPTSIIECQTTIATADPGTPPVTTTQGYSTVIVNNNGTPAGPVVVDSSATTQQAATNLSTSSNNNLTGLDGNTVSTLGGEGEPATTLPVESGLQVVTGAGQVVNGSSLALPSVNGTVGSVTGTGLTSNVTLSGNSTMTSLPPKTSSSLGNETSVTDANNTSVPNLGTTTGQLSSNPQTATAAANSAGNSSATGQFLTTDGVTSSHLPAETISSSGNRGVITDSLPTLSVLESNGTSGQNVGVITTGSVSGNGTSAVPSDAWQRNASSTEQLPGKSSSLDAVGPGSNLTGMTVPQQIVSEIHTTGMAETASTNIPGAAVSSQNLGNDSSSIRNVATMTPAVAGSGTPRSSTAASTMPVTNPRLSPTAWRTATFTTSSATRYFH
jgi:hypothetical protein